MVANNLDNHLIASLKIPEQLSSDNSLALSDLYSLRCTTKPHPDKQFHIPAIQTNCIYPKQQRSTLHVVLRSELKRAMYYGGERGQSVLHSAVEL